MKLVTKVKKLVNGKRISIRNVLIGKTGLPFQNFRLSREFSSGTNQKIVYHLHPKRNFWEFVVNGEQPILSFSRLLRTRPSTFSLRLLRRLTEGKRLFEGWVSFEGIQWLNFRLIVCFGFPIKVLATTTATATKTSKKKYFFYSFPKQRACSRASFFVHFFAVTSRLRCEGS